MLEKKGLVKLVEECGELIQIASKKMACMDTDEHWDGKGSLKARMEEEIADVIAACETVIRKFSLDTMMIDGRCQEKMRKFEEWSHE